jgi:hypothetical protein
MPWKDALIGQMHDRLTPMASSVSVYMMLRPLPPSISTLVSHFMLTIGSTMSRNLPNYGMLFRWSDRSKVITDPEHRRKEGMAGLAA